MNEAAPARYVGPGNCAIGASQCLALEAARLYPDVYAAAVALTQERYDQGAAVGWDDVAASVGQLLQAQGVETFGDGDRISYRDYTVPGGGRVQLSAEFVRNVDAQLSRAVDAAQDALTRRPDLIAWAQRPTANPPAPNLMSPADERLYRAATRAATERVQGPPTLDEARARAAQELQSIRPGSRRPDGSVSSAQPWELNVFAQRVQARAQEIIRAAPTLEQYAANVAQQIAAIPRPPHQPSAAAIAAPIPTPPAGAGLTLAPLGTVEFATDLYCDGLAGLNAAEIAALYPQGLGFLDDVLGWVGRTLNRNRNTLGTILPIVGAASALIPGAGLVAPIAGALASAVVPPPQAPAIRPPSAPVPVGPVGAPAVIYPIDTALPQQPRCRPRPPEVNITGPASVIPPTPAPSTRDPLAAPVRPLLLTPTVPIPTPTTPASDGPPWLLIAGGLALLAVAMRAKP